MQAVILAGGEGTRLRPLTCTLPKPMMPVLNRPFLEHALRRLVTQGVTEVFLTVGYLSDKVQEHFGDGADMGLSLHYALEPQPLGTAGAVKNVASSLQGTTLVCNGDIFTDVDIGQMLAFHREKGAKVTIFLTPVEHPSAFGVVEVDSRSRVGKFIEKPPPDQVTSLWVNGGLYLLEPEVLWQVPPDTYHMFERGLFPRLVELGIPVYGYQARPYWLDMGTPQSYLKLHRDLLLRSTPVNILAADPKDGVWLGTGCRIEPTAVVRGPVLLGEGCTVEAGATVTGPTVLGPGCRVCADATISGSVVWAGSTLGPGATLEGCIVGRDVGIGPRVFIGAGCMVADGAEVGEGNRLEHGLSLWPGKRLEPQSITFAT